MSDEALLVASSLFFVHANRQGEVAIDATRNRRYRSLSHEVFELVAFFVEPAPFSAAIKAGHTRETIDDAIDAGILQLWTDQLCGDSRIWEDRRWSRAGYLTFSQIDLAYIEPTDGLPELRDLSDFRRTEIHNYLQRTPYPGRLLQVSDSPVSLPSVQTESEPDLDSLLKRRSLRSFGDKPLDLSTFSAVLFESTQNVRTAEQSKKGGDPYFLLNSFYSWLNVFVAVQGVEGLERGVYQYDPLEHRLHLVALGVTDHQIVECIQYQSWVNGAGFCLFVVVHWERYMWVYRHSRAYLNLLIQLGEFGQEVLQAISRRGLGAWMTPAITESKAGALLRLDPLRQDAMYFLKVGPPRNMK